MELDQEKETKEAASAAVHWHSASCGKLAPAQLQVLDDSGHWKKLCKMNPCGGAEQGTAALLVVEDPEWVDPARPAVCTGAAGVHRCIGMADCAKQLAAQGLYRDFAWKNRGKAQQTALFCRSAAARMPAADGRLRDEAG